jgi:methyl-accepting chemotaxis protein
VNTYAPSKTTRNDSDVAVRIEHLARSSIALSKLAPDLTNIASRLAAGAQQQASQSREIAANVEHMADELARAMETLNLSSTSVGDIVAAIKRVADQTRILSINASIEAARAGEMGLAFGAVAKEVESLAGQTTNATKQISGSIDTIKANIKNAVDAAGLDAKDDTASSAKGLSIRRLGGEVNEMAAIATDTAKSARSVDETSERVRSLCEDLLLCVGTFRLPAHDNAMRVFHRLLGEPAFSCPERHACEETMRRALREMKIFELLYLTDASGKQITSNLWADGREDISASGKDWSGRPWYKSVVESGEVSVSDIYRSSATDSFCFTLSGPIFDLEGNFVGVLAADVNFADIL